VIAPQIYAMTMACGCLSAPLVVKRAGEAIASPALVGLPKNVLAERRGHVLRIATRVRTGPRRDAARIGR